MPQIRRALHADAHALAQLAEYTFRNTFASENSAENMDVHCRARYGETLQAEEIAREDTVTLLCEVHGDLIGYTQVRWHSAPPCVIAETPGEIQRLYVDRRWHGRGIAQTLMQAALDVLAAQACDVVWLGVWERNPKAIAFYKKIGFVAVGSHTFALGGDPQRDIIMARPLARGALADNPIFGSHSMVDDSTLVTIRYEIQPGMAEPTLQALRALIATVVATEPDCFSIQLLHDPDDNARVLLLERWRTRAAYEGPHMHTPHLLAFMGQARAWLAGPPTIEFWPRVHQVDP